MINTPLLTPSPDLSGFGSAEGLILRAMLTMAFRESPLQMTAVIVSFAIASSIVSVALDDYAQAVLRRDWKWVAFILLVVLSFRDIPGTGTFYGFEYEDSYVYNVAGRQGTLQRGPGDPPPGVLTEVCAVGSLDSCYVSETFSGHYIGYPALIRLATMIMGNTPLVTYVLSLWACCFSAIGIFLICDLLTRKLGIAVAGALIFASTPAIAVYGVASFAEPISSAFITGTLLVYLRKFHGNEQKRAAEVFAWISLASLLVASVLVKRENVLLPLGVIVTSVIALFTNPSRRKESLSGLIAGAVALGLIATQLHLGSTIVAETGEFSGFPFSLHNVTYLFPTMLGALMLPNWFTMTLVFVVVGAVDGARRRSPSILVCLLLLTYMLLYASHVRSSAQIHGVFIGPDSVLRYLVNVMTMWSILAGIGAYASYSFAKRYVAFPKWLLACVVVIYLGACYTLTVKVDRKVQSEEFELRIRPALIASDLAVQGGAQNTYILTNEPLAIQMFGPPSVNVLSLTRVNRHLIMGLLDEAPDLRLIYLKQFAYDTKVDRDRYASQLSCINAMSSKVIRSEETFALIRLFPSETNLQKCL